ncbi:MAG TPA: hypothetical protein VK862_01800 [Afifellaceae bacterium]|nr:hypothetical protein [Afifellaceae bacterium]
MMRIWPQTTLATLVLFRAALAFGFFVFTSLQPAMFADATTKGLHDSTKLVGELMHVEPAGLDMHAQHHHSTAEVPSPVVSSSNHLDMGCDVHCALDMAVPVECQALLRPAYCCFDPVHVSVLTDGEYAACIRPPRYLS